MYGRRSHAMSVRPALSGAEARIAWEVVQGEQRRFFRGAAFDRTVVDFGVAKPGWRIDGWPVDFAAIVGDLRGPARASQETSESSDRQPESKHEYA